MLAITPAVVSAQVPTEHQRAILQAIDLNADGSISREELQHWLRHALLLRARKAGLSPEPSSTEFERMVEAQTYKTLRDATADGNEEISLQEMAGMASSQLISPLGGSVGNLLPSAPKKPSPEAPWSDRLERWIDVRQSFNNEQDVGKPAKLSLVNHHTSDETVDAGKARRVFTIKASAILSGFVEWKPSDRLLIRPILGYEVSTESSTPSKDQILHRAGAVFVVRQPLPPAQLDTSAAPSPPLISSHRLLVTFDHRTDRGYDADVRGGTIQYSFNAIRLGIGRYLGGSRSVDFRWRPYAGVTWAKIYTPGAVEAYQEMSDFTHWYAQFTGELKLGEAVLVTPEASFVRGERPDGVGGKGHKHLSLSGRWILAGTPGSERVSLALSGGIGRQSPDLKKERKVELALGFKF